MATHATRRCLAGLVLLTLTTAPAAADYDYEDSPEFTLDLVTIPTGGTGDWADSASFSIDLVGVNRGWGDSNVFNTDSPPPATDMRVTSLSRMALPLM